MLIQGCTLSRTSLYYISTHIGGNMYRQTRFLKLNNKLYLVEASLNEGNIVDIAGPYQCVSGENVSPQQFIQSLSERLMQALHGGKVLELADLPEKIQESLNNQINDVSPPDLTNEDH
jgi:hypothetical protein